MNDFILLVAFELDVLASLISVEILVSPGAFFFFLQHK